MNLKSASPIDSPGKRADGETEKATDRALGNVSAQRKGANQRRTEQSLHLLGVPAASSHPSANCLQQETEQISRVSFFLPRLVFPFSVLLSFFPSLLFLHLASPSEVLMSRKHPTRALPPQDLPGLEQVSG